MDVNIHTNQGEINIFYLQRINLRNYSYVLNVIIWKYVHKLMGAELRSDRHTVFQSLFSNTETVCKQRI